MFSFVLNFIAKILLYNNKTNKKAFFLIGGYKFAPIPLNKTQKHLFTEH